MIPREPITREWIRLHGGSVLQFHANMGDRHVLVRTVVDKRDGRSIGLAFRDTSWKRSKRNGARGGTSQREWIVDEHGGDLRTLEEALEVLEIQRVGAEMLERAA